MPRKRKPKIHPVEIVPISEIRAHPRNYRGHPDAQLTHIAASLDEHGVYRNVVLAKDGTLLAGHGVLLAAEREGLSEVPAVRLPYDADDPRAIRVLTGDNELGRFAEDDDRQLADLLRSLVDAPGGLVGTGYDEQMLANLIYVTRHADEIPDLDAAAHWAGLPEFDRADSGPKVVVSFESLADRDRFLELIGQPTVHKGTRGTLSVWWPDKPKEDLSSLRFEP